MQQKRLKAIRRKGLRKLSGAIGIFIGALNFFVAHGYNVVLLCRCTQAIGKADADLFSWQG
jgi:hypothetical protein